MDLREALGFGTAATTFKITDNDTAGSAARKPTRAGSYIERPDASLFFKDWDTGDPVVFVHGAGNSSDVWTHSTIHIVKQGFRCVGFDRRRRGRSSAARGGYDYDRLADDLAAVMDAFSLSGATLIGHSKGCGEVVRYLTRHGSRRVARIALIAPTLPFLLETPDNPKWSAADAAPFFMPNTSPQMIQWVTNLMHQTSPHAAIECKISVTETDFREELKKIDAPTLIVRGTADKSRPLEVTGNELKIHAGAPHGLLLTNVQQLNRDLMNFVKQTV